MAKLKEALSILYGLEFSSPSNALHKNKGESGLTFMGIYEKANPKLSLWPLVYKELYTKSFSEASRDLHSNKEALAIVESVYKRKYWDKAKLDLVNSQKIANEIFIFGVNVGMRKAIKEAQKLVGVTQDGYVGPKTLKALNSYDQEVFDYKFDNSEILYYTNLINHNKKFNRFKRGWFKRAKVV